MDSIKIEIVPSYFCRKHGDIYEQPGKCNICGEDLVEEEPYTVEYSCDNCGLVFIGPPSYFEAHPKCTGCIPAGTLHNTLQPQASFNFVIDGIWNGGNVGKKIQQKNEQVKKKWAGMEGDGKSLKQKIGVMVNERLGGKVM